MKRTLELENQLSALSGLLDMTGDFLDAHKVPVPVQNKIKLILDEIFSNIVSYGYLPQDPPDTVLVELCIANGNSPRCSTMGNAFNLGIRTGGHQSSS